MPRILRHRQATALCACACAFFSFRAVGQIPDQYPKPLIHTSADHPAAHILLLSVDGLHAVDLANWIARHPHSALAELSARGVAYTDAHVPWADPAAGLAALVTGGTPISTGIVTSDGYDRAHASPLAPHAQLRVNTIFEVVQQKIGRTAWAGESAATADLLRGPSGKGLDEACGWQDEDSKVRVTAEDAARGDARRLQILLRWIDGRDCSGSGAAAVPSLFGASLTAVQAAQDEKAMGYADAVGTPSAGLEKSLVALDDSVHNLVRELQAQHIDDSTWMVITAPYGEAPMDRRPRRIIAPGEVAAVANSVKPGLAEHFSGGDVGTIWLSEPSLVASVVSAYERCATSLGIDKIISGAELALTLNASSTDERMPDIVLLAQPGVLWVKPGEGTWASHGGWRDEDTHVALLVAGAHLSGRVDKTPVPTSQLAPLLLRALGMEKFDLQALHLEHTPALPGIF